MLNIDLCNMLNGLAHSTADVQAGSVKGTLYWMAPEVMQGKHVGRAADIWSLGCLITEMCTGRPPFVDQLSNRHSPVRSNLYSAIDLYTTWFRPTVVLHARHHLAHFGACLRSVAHDRACHDNGRLCSSVSCTTWSTKAKTQPSLKHCQRTAKSF